MNGIKRENENSHRRNRLRRLSNGLLLAQHNAAVALDIIPEKVEMLKNKKFPIEDREIEEYL